MIPIRIYEPPKPKLYRCSDGLHTLLVYGSHLPKRRPCDGTRTIWRPERGRVDEPCTGVLILRSWLERDYFLRRVAVDKSGMMV